MLQKDDFISVIGYDGGSAIVNKAARSQYRSKSVKELLEIGSFRSATALALVNDSNEELQEVADYYNRLSGSAYTITEIPRLFGISKVSVKKVLRL